MKARDRLALRYRTPAALGLETPEQVSDLIRQLVKDADTENETLAYHAALYWLLEQEIATLAQQVEGFTASGQVSVAQGLDVRLRHLKAERRDAARAAGLAAGTAARLTVLSGGVTWVKGR